MSESACHTSITLQNHGATRWPSFTWKVAVNLVHSGSFCLSLFLCVTSTGRTLSFSKHSYESASLLLEHCTRMNTYRYRCKSGGSVGWLHQTRLTCISCWVTADRILSVLADPPSDDITRTLTINFTVSRSTKHQCTMYMELSHMDAHQQSSGGWKRMRLGQFSRWYGIVGFNVPLDTL